MSQPILAKIDVIDWKGELEVRIAIIDDQTDRWIESLQVLANRRASFVTLQDRRQKRRCVIRLRPDSEDKHVIWVTLGGGEAGLAIPSGPLEYITGYYSKYRHNNQADVDHIHCHAEFVGGQATSGDVTFVIPIAAKPVDPREARRRLGL